MSSSIHFDPRFEQTEAERLGAEITELCGYIYAATYHLLNLIREFDERRYWEEQGFTSCASWLNFKCGFGPNAARERLRVAHALSGLPKIAAEFSEGRLSYSKVRAMTRVATPENEDLLMTVARHGNASHVERLVSQYRRAEKLQHPDRANDIYLAREVSYYYDDDGCLVMKTKIPADQGEVIIKALEMAMDAEFQGVTGNGEAASAADDDPLPVAARRADALCEIAETYLNHPENAGSTADRYMVTLHVEAHKYSHLENGPHVSAETSRRVSCDCSSCTINEDKNGEPLSVGRRSRTIPPAMRRALKNRDGGCRFPGCTNHNFCDGHHIKHWADGGETSLDNLVLLCRHHHHLVHEGGFDCKRSKDGEVWFEDRRAQRLKDYEGSEPVSIEETLAWMYRKFTDAKSADACTAEWGAGETMDMSHAVWLMFQQ
jgi:hypothetical protein